MPENDTHRDNYVGTSSMKAENQDMEFVNDTIQVGKDKKAFSSAAPEKSGSKKK